MLTTNLTLPLASSICRFATLKDQALALILYFLPVACANLDLRIEQTGFSQETGLTNTLPPVLNQVNLPKCQMCSSFCLLFVWLSELSNCLLFCFSPL